MLNLSGICWDYRDAALPLGDPENAVLVKSNARRRVFLARGSYYKETLYERSPLSLLRTCAGGSARREGRMLLALARRGVGVPQVLGFGRVCSRGMLKRDLLVTKAVEGALLRSLLSGLPEKSPFHASEMRRITREFAVYIAHLHECGVLHRDLHLGNILRTPEGAFVLLDVGAVRLCTRPLSLRERIASLAQLAANVWMLASRSARLRFFRAYGQAAGLWDESGGSIVRRDVLSVLDREACRFSMRVWRKKARRSLFSNSRFVREQNHFRIWRVRGEESDRLMEALLPDPDRLMATGTLMKNGHTVYATAVTVGGKRYFVKRYNNKGWWYQLKSLVRRSRALRVWQVCHGFCERGLPIPRPLVCLEERRRHRLQRSYLVSEFVEPASRLSALWPQLDEFGKKTVLVRVAMLLGMMHHLGCGHGDLKWNNILLDTRQRPVLTDLDGAWCGGWLRAAAQCKDQKRFLRDLPEEDGNLRSLLLSVWERWRGRS
ncbi:MAG: hypothetical protein IJM72_07555 [Deltaproteobacteria bacterium]|nr:hypothetical protein [Deltaproteobacteria bacterium]